MPTPTKGPRLGGGPAHERLILANLATALFEHGRITTTEAKAKRLRPLAERLVTFAKRGDLHARRQVLTVVKDKSVVHTLFDEIGPRYLNRPGGYTRIVKVGPRKGDNAPMAVIELVEALTVSQQAVGEAERARGTRFRRDAGAAPAAAAPAAAPVSAAAEATDVAPDDADPEGLAPDDAPVAEDVPEDAAPVVEDVSQSDEVAPEGDGQPAEDVTSRQTQDAGSVEQAEGDDDKA